MGTKASDSINGIDPEGYDHLSAFKLYSLININKKINSLMEIDKLLELIMDSCKVLLNCEGSSLMLVNEEKQVLTFKVVSGESGSSKLKEIEVPIGQGVAGAVAQSGEPLVINDAQNDSRLYKVADEKTSLVTRNIACVPMTTGGKVIGVLEAINSEDRDVFSNDDLLLMMAFAEQAAISITNRKLYDRIKARVDELSALYEISQLNLSQENTDRLLTMSLQIVSRIMECKRCSIQLYNLTQKKLEFKAAIGFEEELMKKLSSSNQENSISSQVFHNVRFSFSENIDSDPRFGPNKRFRYTGRSFICVPMQTQERVIGVLNVTDKKDEGNFSIFDVRLLQTIANQISEVYENLRLYGEERKKIKIEKELEVTRKLQEAIFPKHFPDIPGVSIFGMNLSASEVGGDFYDFYYSPEHPQQFSAVIADVSGKSMPAALFMAISRSILRAQNLQQNNYPSNVLTGANALLREDSESAMFVTTFLIQCDMSTRILTYSNGGHNDPILLRHDSNEVTYLHTRGKPLGIMADAVYEASQYTIQSGDLLILYTDGIIEANNRKSEEFGYKRFEEVVLSNRHLPPPSVAQRITDAVSEFAGGAAQFDDMTLYIFKFS